MSELFDIVTFDTNKVSAINNIPEVYTDIISVTTPSRDAGTYVMGFSIQYTFDSTSTSAYLQFRIDGGPWYEYRREPKDNSDAIGIFYSFPKDLTAGVHTLEVQMRKETAAGILNVVFGDAWFQRVG